MTAIMRGSTGGGVRLLRPISQKLTCLIATAALAAGCLEKTTSQNLTQAVCSGTSALVSSSARISKALTAGVSDATRAACGNIGAYACSHVTFSPEENDS